MDNKLLRRIEPLVEDYHFKVMVRIPETGQDFYEVRHVMRDIEGGLVLQNTPSGIPRYWNIMDVDAVKIVEA